MKHVGYDRYENVVWVERVDELIYVGDCEDGRGELRQDDEAS